MDLFERMDGLLEAPKEAYAPSDASIWTDAHISAEMLKAHLDPGREGASRRHDFMDASADWIAGLLPPAAHPTLLDVGCGPGLYAERFAARGYRVTGVDFSERAVRYGREQAREKGLDIGYVRQDYRTLEWRAAFELAAFIYCDYGALAPRERAAVLGNIHRALVPGGALVMDVFSMAGYAAFREEESWERCEKGGFWSAEGYLAFHRASRFGDALTLRQTAILTPEDARRFCLWDSYFTPESLGREAEAAGFAVCGFYGDVAGAPLTETGQTLAVVLRKTE